MGTESELYEPSKEVPSSVLQMEQTLHDQSVFAVRAVFDTCFRFNDYEERSFATRIHNGTWSPICPSVALPLEKGA